MCFLMHNYRLLVIKYLIMDSVLNHNVETIHELTGKAEFIMVIFVDLAFANVLNCSIF